MTLPPESRPEETPGRYDYYPWMYDLFVEDSVEGDREWYLQQCNRFGGPVLELGCGTGRLTVPLAEEGHEVVGMDRSISMLEYARGYARDQGVADRVRLLQDSMESFSLEERFPVIIIPFCTFSHLVTSEQQGACLQRVRSHLAPEGKLILDVQEFEPEGFEDGYREWPFTEYLTDPTGTVEVRRKIRAWNNPEESRIDYVFLYEERPLDGGDGQEPVRKKSHHALSTLGGTELLAVIRGAGFDLDEIYGDHGGTPYSPGDPWCCLVASVRES